MRLSLCVSCCTNFITIKPMHSNVPNRIRVNFSVLYYVFTLTLAYTLDHALNFSTNFYLSLSLISPPLSLSFSLNPLRSLAHFSPYLFVLFRSRPRTWCIRTYSKQFEVREYLHPLLIRLKAFRWLK